MSNAYPQNTSGYSLPSYVSSSQYSTNPNSIWEIISSAAKQRLAEEASAWQPRLSRGRSDPWSLVSFVLKRIFTATNALIVIWIFTIWRGERTVFQDSINACLWESWESWVGLLYSIAQHGSMMLSM